MIDLEELRRRVRRMRHDSPLYIVLRDELRSLGYWRALPRGNPKAGYAAGWGKRKPGKA